jgi:tRNA-2-methylthio-N6-dimethylallyladenosine synthase
MVTVGVTGAAPHHLIADTGVRAVRRTRAGDAWAARNGRAERTPGVLLGMPAVGVPASLPAAVGGCGSP